LGGDLKVGGARGGGGIFGQVVFELEETLEGVGIFQKVFVFAHGEDGFADEVEDLESGFFEEAAQGVGGEHDEGELLCAVIGEPGGARGFEELLEGINVAALQEMIEGREFVVGGGDDDSVWRQGAANFEDGGRGVGTDGEGIAHGEGEGEVIQREIVQIDDVGHDKGGVLGARAERFSLRTGLVDHVGGVIDEGGGEAGFEKAQAPFAGAAAEVEAGGRGGFGEVGLDGAPGQLVVEFPVAVIVDLVILLRDAVVIFAGSGRIITMAARHRMRIERIASPWKRLQFQESRNRGWGCGC